MGTAESLVGGMVERALDRQDFLSGLGFGCHVVEGLYYWMGGISASGGSIEWLRALLGEQPLSYQELDVLMDEANASPGELLYIPHLAGRGSPNTDPSARGAFVGLSASHNRADLLKAVLEGTAYEMEVIRQTAERATGLPINPIIAAGGGTRNHRWMQIKADVSGCRLVVPSIPEATLLGAALVAGVGCGMYSSMEEALLPIEKSNHVEVYEPDEDRHAIYRCLYEQGYLPLQETLHQYTHRGER
jgi:xylulokinase